jgi:hypothetical protein
MRALFGSVHDFGCPIRQSHAYAEVHGQLANCRLPGSNPGARLAISCQPLVSRITGQVPLAPRKQFDLSGYGVYRALTGRAPHEAVEIKVFAIRVVCVFSTLCCSVSSTV